MRVAWIGLGDMGYPMAGHAAARFDTLVWNRTTAVAEQHADDHGSEAVELEEVARADALFTCLPTSTEVEAIAERLEGILMPDTVWVDCTSGEPAATRDLAARLRAHGVGFVDAPVSGMVDGAVAGSLTVMVGGEDAELARVRPVLESFAGEIIHVGPTGSGHLVKALNNAAFAAHLWVAREVVGALERAGADRAAALAAVNASSGRSQVTERFLATSVYTDTPVPGFRVGLLAKDVRAAARAGGTLLLSELVELYDAVVEEAGWDADAATTFAALGRLADGEAAP